ncbi:hypothetical protein [Agaribacterium haliotis]|uniref:hypothetical protein n=1 Tax=Agaribacterium haliotis TaxID=2013869 RepID=UPI001178A98D|nr:hypothetical protein [Agaribacterium haliotis]
MKNIIFVALLVLSPFSFATDAITTKVLETGIYGNGTLLIIVNDEIPEPGCTGNRIDIPKSHPDIKNILSLALAASASGSDVVLRTHGCLGGNPTMDETNNSLFLFRK